jgi:pseudouridine-5'-phosphate glycosidase
MGMESAVLLVQPPPEDSAMEAELVNEAIRQALAECERQQIRGQAVSPFLLNRVSELTHGESLEANLALLRNNARLAARVACAI